MAATIRLGLLLAMAFTGSAKAAEDHGGRWIISCADGTHCRMRYSKPFIERAGISADLEVMAQGKALVPVLVLRGLSEQALMTVSLAGKAEASLAFAGVGRMALPCGASEAGFICVPSEANGKRLAAALPAAQAVTVRVTVAAAGSKPLPVQEKTLDLAGTDEALGRLRALGPTPVPNLATALAARSPAGVLGMADKALKAAGYPNGVAELQALVAKVWGR